MNDYEEKRKYFDYELAYDGYKRIKELCDKGGIQAIINNDEFEISSGTIEDWACNGYIPIYASSYNVIVYINDRNFDTKNKENDWYVSGEVDIFSYGGGDHNLYINNKYDLVDTQTKLIEYARKNNYSLEDIYAEYYSIINTLKKIQNEK